MGRQRKTISVEYIDNEISTKLATTIGHVFFYMTLTLRTLIYLGQLVSLSGSVLQLAE